MPGGGEQLWISFKNIKSADEESHREEPVYGPEIKRLTENAGCAGCGHACGIRNGRDCVSMKKVRNSSFEAMRVISMLLIIAFHYQIHIDGDMAMYAPFSLNKLILILGGSWGTLGSDLFFLLGCYFLLNQRTIKFEQALHLAIKTSVFGTVVYAGYVLLGKTVFDGWTLFKTLIGPLTYSYWFISAYIILLLVIPAINILLDNISRQYHLGITVCLYWFGYILTDILGYFDLLGRFSCVLFIYFLLSYLERYKKNDHIFEKHPMAGILICSGIVVAYELILTFMGFTVSDKPWLELLESTQSPIMVFDAFFVFYLVKRFEFYSRPINFLGKHTLGGYLLHSSAGIASVLLWDGICKGGEAFYSGTKAFVINYMLSVFGIFFLGIVADFLYEVVLQKRISRMIQKWTATILAAQK